MTKQLKSARRQVRVARGDVRKCVFSHVPGKHFKVEVSGVKRPVLVMPITTPIEGYEQFSWMVKLGKTEFFGKSAEKAFKNFCRMTFGNVSLEEPVAAPKLNKAKLPKTATKQDHTTYVLEEIRKELEALKEITKVPAKAFAYITNVDNHEEVVDYYDNGMSFSEAADLVIQLSRI